MRKSEEIRRKYNPDDLSPFPFQKITEDISEVEIYYGQLPEGVSGATMFIPETKKYNIIVSNKHPKTRQYFTTAHELGHYFLHSETIKQEGTLIDEDDFLDGPRALYRLDISIPSKIEKEANNFAANLLMPESLVRNAWNSLKDVEECAHIFNVSVSAMSVRLERLKILSEAYE